MLKSKSLLTTVKYKIENNSKTKNRRKKLRNIITHSSSFEMNIIFEKKKKRKRSGKKLTKKIIQAKNERQTNSNLPCKFRHL